MQKQTENASRYRINSIDKALDLLELLAEEPLNLLELAERLDRPKSSLYRIITTLEERGYITREEETEKYCLGLKTLKLTKNLLENNTLRNVSRFAMQDLLSITGESVNLGVLTGEEILYVAVLEGTHQLKFTEVVGSKAPFHASAIGKVIAAHLPDEQLDRLLAKITFEKLTPKTIDNKEDYIQELKIIKERGHALDNEEVATGARCIAAPIFNMFGRVEAAISISGAIHRMPDNQLTQLSAHVIDAAKTISTKLGYDGYANHE